MPKYSATALPYTDDLRMDELIRKGVPAAVLKELAEWLDVGVPLLASALQIPRRTLERRLAANKALPLDEGERALRIGRLLAKATRVFEDRDEAATWFNTPLAILGDATPLALCATEAGARAVEQALGRLEHGVFA